MNIDVVFVLLLLSVILRLVDPYMEETQDHKADIEGTSLLSNTLGELLQHLHNFTEVYGYLFNAKLRVDEQVKLVKNSDLVQTLYRSRGRRCRWIRPVIMHHALSKRQRSLVKSAKSQVR